MMTPIPIKFQEIIHGSLGLREYLKSLPEYKDFTQRSWLYDGEEGNRFLTGDEVRDKWLSFLVRRLHSGDESMQNVLQLEYGALDKWGPQGGHPPLKELLDEVVYPTFLIGEEPNRTPGFETPEWNEAVEDALRILITNGVHDLVPRSPERVTVDMSARGTLESNSGFPDFTRRSTPRVRERAEQDARSGAWKDYPAILLFRRYRGKTRMVWMFPMATNIVEGQYFQPLFEAIQRSPALINAFFCPWKGFEAVRELVTNRMARGSSVGASDFSSTDAHFQKSASEQVLRVLEPLFKPQYRDGLRESVLHQHSIPLLINETDMLVGDHGVASGSNWTNFVETVFDLIFGLYVQKLADKELYALRPLYAIGDDMAWETWIDEDYGDVFGELLERAALSVGQVIKAEKTEFLPNKVKTLQRQFQRGYSRPDGMLRGVYPTMRALNSSVYPERFHFDWDKDYFCSRQFMILENCVDHPLFEDFVAFVVKGNKHLIPFALKSDKELGKIYRKAKLIPGLVSTYNPEKRDEDISKFESLRIARELAK